MIGGLGFFFLEEIAYVDEPEVDTCVSPVENVQLEEVQPEEVTQMLGFRYVSAAEPCCEALQAMKRKMGK